MPSKPSTPSGFSRDFSGREAPAIGIFGAEGTGKTRLCATAGQYAAERDQIPGWLVCDRKTRKTVRETCESLGLDLPYINSKDFISQNEALEIAQLDRETDTDNAKIQKIYTGVVRELIKSAIELGRNPVINPIVLETGSQIWDWISYSHFGRKQGVGKSRVWGPPKQTWTDLVDGLSHKTLLITFWERDAYKGDDRLNFTKPDGPPHIGYCTTSLVRLTCDQKMKLKDDQTYIDRFGCDIYESQDNVGLAGVNDILRGESITYENLMALLSPES